MQKKIIAMAATLLCGSALPVLAQNSGASKVELWGIVDAAVRHTNNEGAGQDRLTKMIGGGMSQSRWGLNIEEDLGGGSKAIAHMENRFNADDGSVSTPFFQLAYVGLQGPYGRLTMGRQWNVLFDVVTSTYSSFPYSPYMDAYKPELGMAAGARTSNALKYTLATPSRNWVGTLQYSFEEGNDTKKIEQGALSAAGAAQVAAAPGAAAAGQAAAQAVLAGGGTPAQANAAAQAAGYQYTMNAVGQAVGAYATGAIPGVASGALKTMGGFLRYSENGVSVGGGFLRTELPGGSDLDAWTIGGSYRSGPLYVNVGYGLNKIRIDRAGATDIVGQIRNQTDLAIVGSMWSGQTNGGFQPGDADKRQMMKVGFGYQITPQINAGLHYFHAKQSGGASGLYNGKANFMIAAVDYAFSKRTDAYFAVDHTKLSGGSAMAIDTSGARSRTGITAGIRHRF
ncbi:porin [Comamonas sp. NoAH]|uniref:porin n=1 Tax=Comamonas halotolerans TaxID=3041496 RepID=UPI0024E113A8|nr:porin [Comamonas sp. NoAH]